MSWNQLSNNFTLLNGKQADTKAQVFLGFTGIFLSLIAVSALETTVAAKPSQLFLFTLLLTFACYLISIGYAMSVLMSRGVFRNKGKGTIFFAAIANCESSDEYAKVIDSVLNTEDYPHQLQQSILILAQNTRLKHQHVNLVTFFSGLGLISTLVLALVGRL